MKNKRIISLLMVVFLVTMLGACKKEHEEVSESAAEPKSEISVIAKEEESEVVSESKEISEEESTELESKSEEASKETPKVTGTPLEVHGNLSVKGTHLTDCNGNDFQLCGVSTHGIGWFPEYVSKESFQSLRDDWGANVVRLAMYTAEGAGYCTGGDRDKLKTLVTDGVDYATELGMYVIVDWHILHDLDPNVYKDDAKAFFDEISKKYKDNNNVIYEICNEPNGGTSWESVKSYAAEVIPIIRANDPDAVIIVGTPTWSQDVDIAAKDPITGFDNLMYAIHFYADTHRDDLRNKMKTALDSGLPLFITEFSICEASGNGYNNVDEANKWIALADEYKVSFVAWNLSNKAESSSLIQSGCTKKYGWNRDELSESGSWLVGVLGSHNENGAGFFSKDKSTAGNSNSSVAPKDDVKTPSTSASGSKDNLKVTTSLSNSWSSGNSQCGQFNLSLSNSGSSDVSNWTIELDFGQAVSVDQCWCCKAQVSGNKVVITPESFNGTVSKNSSISDIGLIVSAKSALGAPVVTIK